MRPAVKALDVALTIMLLANLKNFTTIKQIYDLTIERLSAKMCTITHGDVVGVVTYKITIKG